MLHRFTSHEGYELYSDVLPFFQRLQKLRRDDRQEIRNDVELPRLQVGIITNSDDRVPTVLSSLGLRVSSRRLGSTDRQWTQDDHDIDIHWIVMSYDAGYVKPDTRIFEAAKKLKLLPYQNCLYLHVGDDVNQDYCGAMDAGWQSILLDRECKSNGLNLRLDRIQSLESLDQKILEMCSV